MTAPDALSVNDYTVGIICLHEKQLRALRFLLDSVHSQLPVSNRDTNDYILGKMGGHNVVVTCLPSTQYGTSAAAALGTKLYLSFPMVQFALVVGMAGGVPIEEDIRLGDVVVGVPSGAQPGIIQYDFGKDMAEDCFIHTGSLQRPPRVLLSAISGLNSEPYSERSPLQDYLDAIAQKDSRYGFPGRERDHLFPADCVHNQSHSTCSRHLGAQIQRTARNFEYPCIHYGLIGSGDRVVNSAVFRDRVARKHNILCFETEAAGIVNIMPSLVIRGICDYADSHKSGAWQAYAAGTAAAYARVILDRVRPYNIQRTASSGPYGQA